MLRGIDIVAIVAIITCGFLIYSGHNGMIVSLLATIIGWYFGRRSFGNVVKKNEKKDG
jgi:hypothetical protein